MNVKMSKELWDISKQDLKFGQWPKNLQDEMNNIRQTYYHAVVYGLNIDETFHYVCNVIDSIKYGNCFEQYYYRFSADVIPEFTNVSKFYKNISGDFVDGIKYIEITSNNEVIKWYNDKSRFHDITYQKCFNDVEADVKRYVEEGWWKEVDDKELKEYFNDIKDLDDAIAPRTKEQYEALKAQLAIEHCPMIYPCVHCGYPVITGYACTSCNSRSPDSKD